MSQGVGAAELSQTGYSEEMRLWCGGSALGDRR
jgi:hypothetical protein